MSDAPVTLNTLLWNGSSSAGANALIDAVKQHAPVDIAKLPTLQWRELAQAVEDQVATGFDTSLGAILVRSWSDLAAIREAADPRRTPPDTTRSVPLVEHSIESVHHPKLEITIEGLRSFDVVFEVKLALKITGAILGIRNARIREIRLGECRGEATLSLGGHTLHRYELGSARFPGHIRFAGEGMPIGQYARDPVRRH
ncbi:hypothetical protein FAZ95_11955 [Trinickia violacea]|uniref:Uncharacterized protein n=1 Tax=Trinickia violacea TaxID=2571746 RepID=A0A4P8INF3_9BURK|nr:hypothetical protein [Trinickia violacea]QCP49826.1 hypothetical protein FAZ95_11955 [Trinickia violacea]